MIRRLLLAAAALWLLSGAIALQAIPQDEDQPQERQSADGKKCDNSFERAESDRCACEHAETCNPNDPDDVERHSKMTSKCQWYCHEDKCACANACAS